MEVVTSGSVSWALDVTDVGGEGNSHRYHVIARIEEVTSHVTGSAAWDFVLTGDWEIAEFPAVLRKLADLFETVRPSSC